MATPLSIKFAADIDDAKRGMASLAASVASNGLTIGSALKAVNDNATKVSAGLNAMRFVGANFLPIVVAAGAAVVAYKAIGAAVDAAKESVDDFVKIGNAAQNAGVGSGFLQRWQGEAKALKAEVSDLTKMLDHAREASTERIGEGQKGNTSAIQERLSKNVQAGNLQQGDLDRFTGAKDQEARIRVILDLIDQLRQRGMALAGFDLANKMFGPGFEQKLRDGIDATGKMRESLDSLAATAGGNRIISPEEIQNANSITLQLERIDNLLAAGIAPIQRDLIKLGQDQYQGWLNIKESIAEAVAEAGRLYSAVRSVLAAIDAITGSNPLGTLATKLGAIRIRDALGIKGTGEPDNRPDESTRNKSGGAAPIPLPEIVSRGDRSRPLPSGGGKAGGGAGAEADPLDAFIKSLERSTAALKAEVETYGKSNVEKQKALALAKAEEIAKQRGSALTDEETRRILASATAAGVAKDKLAELQQQSQQAAEAMKQFGSMATDALADIILDGKNAGDVFRGLEKQIAKMALSGLLNGTGPFAGLFGTAAKPGDTTGAGGLFGMLGGLFKGIGANAEGTDDWRGGPTWVGEKGPEIVNLPKGATVTPNAKIPNLMAPQVQNAGSQTNVGPTNVTHNPTYNIAPAGGVTPEQLGPILQAHGNGVVQEIQRNFSGMQTLAQHRFPMKR